MNILILVTINNSNTINWNNLTFSEYSNDDESKSEERKSEGNSNEENKRNEQSNHDSDSEGNESKNNNEALEEEKSETKEDFEEILEPFKHVIANESAFIINHQSFNDRNNYYKYDKIFNFRIFQYYSENQIIFKIRIRKRIIYG